MSKSIGQESITFESVFEKLDTIPEWREEMDQALRRDTASAKSQVAVLLFRALGYQDGVAGRVDIAISVDRSRRMIHYRILSPVLKPLNESYRS